MSQEKNGIRFGLRWRLTIGLALVVTLVEVVVVSSLVFQMRGMAVEELAKRGSAMGSQLAAGISFETFSNDKVGLQKAARGTLRDEPDVAYVRVLDTAGNTLVEERAQGVDALPSRSAHTSSEMELLSAGGRDFQDFVLPIRVDDEPQAQPATADDPLGPMDLVAADAADQADHKTAVRPARGSSGEIGTLQLGFRIEPLRAKLAQITFRSSLLGLLALAVMLAVIALLARYLTRPLERLATVAAATAQGDLRQKVEVLGTDEIGQLARSFDTMLTALRGLLADLRAAALDVDRESATILSTATQQSAMAAQQSSAISETTATVTEIAETSRQATEHADSVIQVTQKSEDLSREGQRSVTETQQAVEKLAEQVKAIALSITELSDRAVQIGDIIGTVKDLAEQTNLLALNASIEAAKAGEHGKGFAVVAMEMRNLAEQSKLAAQQVRTIISEVQKGTRTAVATTEEGSKRAHSTMALTRSAGASIVGLAEVIQDSSIAARQIAGNTRQQTVGVEQILSAITQLQSSMAETLTGTRGIEKVAGNLSTLSRRLSELTGRYQV